MPTLSSRQRSVLKSVFNDHMDDKCTIQIRSDVQQGDGSYVATFTSTYTNVPCNFEFSPFKFRAREFADLGQETGEILVRCRLPAEYLSLVALNDRIVLTHRYQEALDQQETYDIQGFTEHSVAGNVLNLRRVEV